MAKKLFFESLSDIKPSEQRADTFEQETFSRLLENFPWLDRNEKTTVMSCDSGNYQYQLTVMTTHKAWQNGLGGRYNRIRDIGTTHFDLGDDVDRIDSDTFRNAMVTMANVIETKRYPEMAFLNGNEILAIGNHMVAAMPLPLERLAAATKGGHIAMHMGLVYFFATIALANEYRTKHGFAGGGAMEVVSTIGNDGAFVLRVTTPTIHVILEQAVLVRRFFREETITTLFTHEPEVLAEMDTQSARRAFRKSVRETFEDSDRNHLRVSLPHTIGTDAYTVLRARDGVLSLARMRPSNEQVTRDKSEWRFATVSDGEVQTPDAKAWQMVEGWLFEFLPLVSERVHVGLTDRQTGAPVPPVLLWNDDGLRIAVTTASVREM